ncbi:hypothetical protein LR48_Vigan10g194500 [Vigna angularis]|uniref:Reverse transcriptase domain-containing protein n=1 Tax=Phaseolus angularis TaxID=3914 RepID=A0A0L9VM60_PHAAN|nr:hypothetical protein LR48_Vigan10g194500 [Vigna angularis]
MEEFVRDFEVLMGQTRGIPDEQVLGYFLAGLRDDVKVQVRIQNPSELMEAMRIARDVEGAIMQEQGGYGNGVKVNLLGTRSTGTVLRSEPNRNATPQTARTESTGSGRRDGVTTHANARVGATAGNENRGRMVRNLPYPEFLKRKEEGRCFRCGGPFAPGHRCTEKSLRVLLLAEDEEEDECEEVGSIEEKPMELSACSVEGLTTPKTLKLRGRIGEREVVVLVDSGASHNYISRKLVEELELPTIDTRPYSVSLGDGHRRMTRGRCEKIRVELGDATVEEEFFVFELGEVDVILGVAWLGNLGEVRVNWGEMTMIYNVDGRKIKIRGDPTLARQLVEPRTLSKIVDAVSWALVWSLNGVEQERDDGWSDDLTGDQKAELEALLQAHYSVFQETKGLPPSRDKEHNITLKEGVDPINVRPYRYPHFMKSEIEKQVTDMTKAGLIRPSSSPFSSPVILVKKKDGSWRFCVDYRALNRATVPDKFPIPVIEELLDELKGAKYFSKIDLKAGYHQIRMNEDDVPKTAFRTHQGHFEFLVMPFGLMNAPATFQGAMNKLFQNYLRKFVLVFFL